MQYPLLSISPPAENLPKTRKETRLMIQEQIAGLPPNEPGVYVFRDRSGLVIYIGKAKRLRARVQSYFRPNGNDGRSQFRLIRKKTAHIDYIITDTEQEAFMLEYTLIKKHKPRYNIELKDDKSYPYLKITHEPFPRILVTRNMEKDGSRYLGPFSDVKAMRSTLNTACKLFRIRTCDFTLPKPSVRHCIDFEMKRCDGPCEGSISQTDYKKNVDEAVKFLTGRPGSVISALKREMEGKARDLQFETAAVLRDRIRAFESMTARQRIWSSDLSDWDAVALAIEDDEACAVVFQIREGKLMGRQRFFLKGVLNNPDPEILKAFLTDYYSITTSVPGEIHLRVLPTDHEILLDWLRGISEGLAEFRLPQRGVKANLLALAEKNACKLLLERRLKRENRRAEPPGSAIAMQRDLHLKDPPRRVECLDISTTQGAQSVGSLVCFVDGQPRKSEYRHFKIQNVDGQDDFECMREIITRRYKRLLEENKSFPDLLVVDGGKGQLSAVLEALGKLGISEQPVVSLAKRLEEIFLPGLAQAQNLPKNSSTLRLLQQIRDESHRFAILYHKKNRQRETFRSEIDAIPGIGDARKKDLLRRFGSLAGLRRAPVEEIAQVKGIGEKTARAVFNALHRETASNGLNAAEP